MRAFGIGVIIVSFVAIAYMASTTPTQNPIDRIRDECQRTYGDMGSHKVSECSTNLALRYLRDSQRDRLDQTYRNAQ
jgi:hypothetical protein